MYIVQSVGVRSLRRQHVFPVAVQLSSGMMLFLKMKKTGLNQKSMDNNIKIRKVPLEMFIEILTDLYNKGVDYVDIIGILDETQDSIGISFCKDYMDEELKDNFDKIPVSVKKNDQINISLSDEDLNQLL